MNFLRKIIVLFLLTHLVASTVLHKPLVWLCKYSGKDNYFWAKVAFWIGIGLCISTIRGVLFVLNIYVIIPQMLLGVGFYLPSVANKFRKANGESVPIEMALVLPLAFGHIFTLGLSLFFMIILGSTTSDFMNFAGYALSYTSVCFLVDREDGGKSLLKRASERSRSLAHKAKDKLGSNDALPQPV